MQISEAELMNNGEKLFSFGNSKLPPRTAIFNMTSATLCPSRAQGLCQLTDPSTCYALKAERLYPEALPYRKRQTRYYTHVTADKFVKDLMSAIGDRGRINTSKRVTELRFNEAGDFKNQEDVDKAESIARALIRDHNFSSVYCYTARKDLDFSGCKHLTISGSGFMVHNEFTVADGQSAPEDAFWCPGNCNLCHACKHKNGITVYNKLH